MDNGRYNKDMRRLRYSAGLTTAGIIAPVIIHSGVNPNLMVLSIGAGSLVFSHVNDSGFWLFKEYFNLNMKDTLKSWTAMETIVAIVGLNRSFNFECSYLKRIK